VRTVEQRLCPAQPTTPNTEEHKMPGNPRDMIMVAERITFRSLKELSVAWN
jgi:hypothetical protein